MRHHLLAGVALAALVVAPPSADAASPDVRCHRVGPAPTGPSAQITAVASIVAPGALHTYVRCDVLHVDSGTVVGSAEASCRGPVCATAETVGPLAPSFYALCWTGSAYTAFGDYSTPYTCDG